MQKTLKNLTLFEFGGNIFCGIGGDLKDRIECSDMWSNIRFNHVMIDDIGSLVSKCETSSMFRDDCYRTNVLG